MKLGWNKDLWLLSLFKGHMLRLYFDSTAKHVGDSRCKIGTGSFNFLTQRVSMRWIFRPTVAADNLCMYRVVAQRAQPSHCRLTCWRQESKIVIVLKGPSLASWPDRRVPAKDRAPRYLSGSQLFCDSKEARGNQASQNYNTKIRIASIFIPYMGGIIFAPH